MMGTQSAVANTRGGTTSRGVSVATNGTGGGLSDVGDVRRPAEEGVIDEGFSEEEAVARAMQESMEDHYRDETAKRQ